MKKHLLLILSTVCIVSASQSAADIFNRCGVCHGEQGQKHSLNLTQPIAGMEEDSIAEILTQYRAKTRNKYGLGTMMQNQAKDLSNNDIDALAKHISKLPKPVEKVVVKAIDSNISIGEKIFQKCAICHGKEGDKHSLKVSKLIAGMNKDSIISILAEYQAGTRNTYGYGSMMRGQATKLSKEELNEVAKYISSLELVEPLEKVIIKNKKVTTHVLDYKTYIKEWFAKSKDPNASLAEAKKSYEEYKKSKEKNEQNK